LSQQSSRVAAEKQRQGLAFDLIDRSIEKSSRALRACASVRPCGAKTQGDRIIPCGCVLAWLAGLVPMWAKENNTICTKKIASNHGYSLEDR
jgi:hypothetical protein